MNPSENKTKLAIFASGAGTNTQKIIDYFRNHSRIEIALIVCNNPAAGVLNIAKNERIPEIVITKEKFTKGGYSETLLDAGIRWVVLAGFLWKIPASLIAAFPSRIVNIHPALLPAYGGKGMYGMHVHEAVVNAHEPRSGITIHLVDEQYDHGEIILQKEVSLSPGETAETLAAKIHQLEHRYFAPALEKLILDR